MAEDEGAQEEAIPMENEDDARRSSAAAATATAGDVPAPLQTTAPHKGHLAADDSSSLAEIFHRESSKIRLVR